MVRVSLALGIIAAVAGLMAIGFGIPIQAFGLGNTLIMAGSTVFSAGLVVIALSLVLRAIDQLSRELRRPVALEPDISGPSFEHQPVAPPQSMPEWPPAPVAPPPREESPYAERPEPRRAPMPARSGWQDDGAEPVQRPAVRPPGAPPPRFEREPMPAPPLERETALRPRSPSRTERAERPPREPVMERPQQAPELERRREPVVPGEQGDEGAREPRVDPYAPPERRRVFGWTRRSKERREDAAAGGDHAPEPEFGAPASAGRAPQGPAESRELPRAPMRGTPPEPRERPAPPPAPAPRVAAGQHHAAAEDQHVAVLKQGTVDGMSYTLYTDGSIDAEFPEGRIRFNSIEELRQHLEAQG
jgi:hypothetical protein